MHITVAREAAAPAPARRDPPWASQPPQRLHGPLPPQPLFVPPPNIHPLLAPLPPLQQRQPPPAAAALHQELAYGTEVFMYNGDVIAVGTWLPAISSWALTHSALYRPALPFMAEPP